MKYRNSLSRPPYRPTTTGRPPFFPGTTTWPNNCNCGWAIGSSPTGYNMPTVVAESNCIVDL